MTILLFSVLLIFSANGFAQNAPQFEIDTSWPKPLPDNLVHGQLGGNCIDSHDHIAVVDRRTILDKEMFTAKAAAPIQFFDIEGNLVHSFGDPDTVPTSIHGCEFDADDNIYVAGNRDGIIQKYSHDGDLLLQIGKRGEFDSSDGTLTGDPKNSSTEQLFRPSDIEIDPENGDIYISDGYGNRRVAVFDNTGKFLRQWGRQATNEESEQGVGGVFTTVVHCITMSNEGLLYVCDRQGDRIHVFDKQGKFIRNIWVRTAANASTEDPDYLGTVWSIEFSKDPEQKYLYVVNGYSEKVHILDHQSGEVLSSIGRPGHYPGQFTFGHTIAIDSKGNMYIAETVMGQRVQRFNLTD